MQPHGIDPPKFLWGTRLLESTALTLSVEKRIRRTWRERLLTRPWQPWKTERVEWISVPDPNLYKLGDCVVGHPATIAKFREPLLKKGLM